jgi:16S rRNA (guanine(1405)-N(7))-methyltransferase
VTEQESIVARVAGIVSRASRYRNVDAGLVRRIAGEELPQARSEADAVKRVKRRLHQAVGAYRSARSPRDDPLRAVREAWAGNLRDPAFEDACGAVLMQHASTRERLPHIQEVYRRIWDVTAGPPASVLDLGCGLGPLALPWMELPSTTLYAAVDVDGVELAIVDEFFDLVGQPHEIQAMDLADKTPASSAEMALLLKLVPILDRQDPTAAVRLLREVDVRHAVVSFPGRSLGGREKGMERSYRARLEELLRDLGPRVLAVSDVSVPNELVFVLSLDPARG